MSRRVLVALIGLASIVVIAAVWYAALWRPKVNSINQVKAQVVADNNQAAQLQSELAVKREEALQYPAARATISRTKLAIPANANIAQLIYYVNNASEASKVAFLSINDAEPSPQSSTASSYGASAPISSVGEPSTITLSISGNGTFFNVLNFINHLDAMPRLVVIQTLSLSPAGGSVSASGGTSSSPLLAFSISALAFTGPTAPTLTRRSVMSAALTTRQTGANQRALIIGGISIVVLIGGYLGYKEIHKSDAGSVPAPVAALAVPVPTTLPTPLGGRGPALIPARNPFVPLVASGHTLSTSPATKATSSAGSSTTSIGSTSSSSVGSTTEVTPGA